MMKIKLLLLLMFVVQLVEGQNKDYRSEVVELAKIYRNFHFANNPPEDTYQQLAAIKTPELAMAKAFISELIKTKNNILDKKYLTKPDTATLKNLYIIRGVNSNLFEADPKDNNAVMDSLFEDNIDYYELLSDYYGMIFVSVTNKNKPFDLSDVNFTLWDYNLENDTEKGIFFLEGMKMWGTMIWGYMNIVKPPNFKEALKFIKKFPKYNGQPYYQYLDLNITDFLVTTDKRKPKESYKAYYLNKYMNTVLYHALCLSQKKKDEKKRNDVLLGSIIKTESYWQYSQTPEIFQQIFKKVKE